MQEMQDLGTLQGDVLLFGGPYSNLQASEAVLGEAAERGILAGNAICTGDVTAYCGQPRETVAALRAWGCVVVAGNCEVQLAAEAMDCGCGFEAGTACDLLSAGWFAHVSREVDVAARVWMAGLPGMVVFRHAGRRVAVIHGGVTEIARFIWETSPEAVFAEEVAAIEAAAGPVDMVVAGHSGIAFRREVAGVMWVNAGVIGMPPHNGLQATSFAILSENGIEICDLRYDAREAFAEMQRAGLTQGYDRALLSGYWPSEDVLPSDLRESSRASG
ncbi:calcineurin-like phosphoesterase family protein [Shimia abyssi]|uniref:Calcineurin-like phosphoesterase family protein n=1 Tax=Shimia abyssi TaxID=1662395 RepID=A0A2P8F6T9_9RHOB|nr:calcineurin-like phosphoesterase family protein [Shimia abyssi]